MRPEVSSVPDLLIELEREIFRDEPGQDHPTPLPPISEPTSPMMTEPPVEDLQTVPLPDNVKNWVGDSLRAQIKDTYEEITQKKPHGEIKSGK